MRIDEAGNDLLSIGRGIEPRQGVKVDSWLQETSMTTKHRANFRNGKRAHKHGGAQAGQDRPLKKAKKSGRGRS